MVRFGSGFPAILFVNLSEVSFICSSGFFCFIFFCLL